MPPSNCFAYAFNGSSSSSSSSMRRSPNNGKRMSPVHMRNNVCYGCGGNDEHKNYCKLKNSSRVKQQVMQRSSPGWVESHPAQVKTGLFLLCITLYWNSLQSDFVFDDITAIRDNRDLRPHVPWKNLFYNDFWGTPMNKEQSHKSYRPITVFTFRLNYMLGELDPMGYHLVNVLLHGAVTLLYYSLCSRLLSRSSVVGVVASALFAAHPVSHSDGPSVCLSVCLSVRQA
jgi:hypothetical protein